MTTNETFKAIDDFTHKGVEQVSSLGNLNLRIFERLAALQAETVNLAVEHSVRLAKLATDSKDYNEFFKGHVEASKDLSERLMSVSKENLQLAGQVNDDYRAWFEKSLAEVSADLRKTVPAK
jgi:phasin family protein